MSDSRLIAKEPCPKCGSRDNLARYDDEGNGWMRYAEMLHALDRTTEAYDAIARGIAAADKYRHSGLIADLEALRESFDD